MNLEMKNPFLQQPSNQFITIQISVTWWHSPGGCVTWKIGWIPDCDHSCRNTWERCIVTFFSLTQWLYCFLIWVTDTYCFIWLIHAISWLTWRTLETKGFIMMVLWSHPHFSLPFITPYFPPSLCVQREVHQREVLAFSLIITTTTLVSIFLENENIYKAWGLHMLWMIFQHIYQMWPARRPTS